MTLHRHSGADDSLRSYPGAVFEDYGFYDEVEGGFFIVVVAGEEQGSLGEAAISTDLHGGEVIDPGAFPDPGMVSDLQVPRILNIYGWVDTDSLPYFGSKQTQQ